MVERLFDEKDKKMLERVWQSLFKRYNQVLGALGGRDFKVEHTGTEKRQKKGKLQSMVDINQEAYQKALDWWAGGSESDKN